MMMQTMYVTKRSGQKETMSFDKIVRRLRNLCNGNVSLQSSSSSSSNPAASAEPLVLTSSQPNEQVLLQQLQQISLQAKYIQENNHGIGTGEGSIGGGNNIREDTTTATGGGGEQLENGGQEPRKKFPPLTSLNIYEIAQRVIAHLKDGMTTTDIDEYTAGQCHASSNENLDYATLATRVIISNHIKNTSDSFEETMRALYFYQHRVTGQHAPLISSCVWQFVQTYGSTLDRMIDPSRDYLIDYFGFKTVENAYLMRINSKVVERPQHMFLRVAVGIHIYPAQLNPETGRYTWEEPSFPIQGLLQQIRTTYDLMSLKYYVHATPTLFNAGTHNPQLSSCFLVAMKDDSIVGIFDTLKTCAQISKFSGGIGLHVHNIRATGSFIHGTNGYSQGLVPMLKIFNDTARYVDQGGGKRKGSFAIYLEPWHADIVEVLAMRRNDGDENMKSRDLFYALWVPDLFMKRVKQSLEDPTVLWTLFSPDECPGLADTWGDAFEALYLDYEAHYETRMRKPPKTIPARKLWDLILRTQMETGVPYILYKDAANAKSNQQHLGTIKSSNLCTEIIQYSSPDETAVCNLASIALPSFVVFPSTHTHDEEPSSTTTTATGKHKTENNGNCEGEDAAAAEKESGADDGGSVSSGGGGGGNKQRPYFRYDYLHQVVKLATKNMNRVIDATYYSTECARKSNMAHRPIGLGVQGLADVFQMMNIPFESDEARQINRFIFETIYHAAIESSQELAEEMGHAYSSFEGSPLSRGLFQFDLWNKTLTGDRDKYNESTSSESSDGNIVQSMYVDWAELRAKVKRTGVYNSLLVAPMPTATTAQILGFNECFEPMTNNVYTRRVLAGEYMVINKYLVRELMSRGLWTKEIREMILRAKGSIQQLHMIPESVRNVYKIVWEIPMRTVIDMAADRGIYVCQSQSMNLYMKEPTYYSLTRALFYAWQKGLKTGMYYLRRQSIAHAQQFTLLPQQQQSNDNNNPGLGAKRKLQSESEIDPKSNSNSENKNKRRRENENDSSDSDSDSESDDNNNGTNTDTAETCFSCSA